jgi:hypothetical protein
MIHSHERSLNHFQWIKAYWDGFIPSKLLYAVLVILYNYAGAGLTGWASGSFADSALRQNVIDRAPEHDAP